MKYKLDKPDDRYNCLYEGEVFSSQANGYFKTQTAAGSVAQDLSTQYLTEQRKVFLAYISPYSGAFDLLDTLRIPRACALDSVNMTQMDYFYGQNTKTYDMAEYNYDKYLNKMDDEVEFVFQNGSSTNSFAQINFQGQEISVQTNDENLVGTQRTIIRACDKLSNLLEMNFYINVSSNSAPEFDTDLQTQWTLDMHKWENYTLPSYTDPEGNDGSVLYINSMENQEFPDFVEFENATKTLKMKPYLNKHQGRTFYFSVVLKESNSDYMLNIYYMTIKVAGEPIDEEENPFVKTAITMEITEITKESHAGINATRNSFLRSSTIHSPTE